MLHCYSVSHHNTPLSIRERIGLSQQQLATWLQHHAHHRLVVLSTCNRVELYAVTNTPQAAYDLWEDLLVYQTVPLEELEPYTTHLTNFDAANHLMHVASSLRSMALGEAQILGQVTNSFELAQEHGTVDHQLSLLFRAAIHAAKRIHTETNIDIGNVSVSSLGIAKIEAELGALDDKHILVIGAGEMGQAVIKGLDRRHLANVQLVSRTFETAKQIAQAWGIKASPITQLKDLLSKVDIVFTTSSAPFPILSVEDIAPIMVERDGCDLYLVDIAVPRDVDAAVDKLPNVHVFNVDDLQQTVDHNLHEREQAIPHAYGIIESELTKFWENMESLSVVPTICQIREQADTIRQSELERIMGKLPQAERQEVAALFEEFSHRFMNKMLHHPTQNLRMSAANGNRSMMTMAARDLFGLEDA